MKTAKFLAIFLALALLLCLIPATALADPDDRDAEDPAEEEAEELPEEDKAPEEEDEEPEGDEGPEETEETAPVVLRENEFYYPLEGEIVFNNGGTVYNNGALVYNNGGLVYQNAGTAYNNGGVIYVNGGTVYNNGGTVYRNEGLVYTFADDVSDSRIYGSRKLTLAADYSAFAEIEGLRDDGLIFADEAITIIPREGWLLTEIEADAGVLSENEDGSWTLSEVDADLTLTLQFRAEAPAFDLEEGCYAEEQSLRISGPEGAEIYYSIDGSDPTEEGQLYSEPLSLTEGVTVTAVAVAEGAEPSEPARASYAFLSISAPDFEDAEEGDPQPKAAAFIVDNPGSTDARVESVKLEGKDAKSFILNTEKGAAVKAGKTNEHTWTIRPVSGLKKGTYSAVAVFTLAGGQTVELPVQFTVK